jgi:hypothetical protein
MTFEGQKKKKNSNHLCTDNIFQFKFPLLLSVLKCLNMVSVKLKALNCLIQGIINYVQINTYWSSIVQIGIFIIVASNILLLASKKCFLTTDFTLICCL